MPPDAAQYALTDLLRLAGAQLRGNRADCPVCHSRRTVSYDGHRGLFCCHHAGCAFRGNAYRLARWLGLPTDRLGSQYRALQKAKRRVEQEAQALAQSSLLRRWKVQEVLRACLSIKEGAIRCLRRDSQNCSAWAALEYSYREFPVLTAELLLLEDGHARDVKVLVSGSEEARRALIEQVVLAGGMRLRNGNFLPLER